MKKISSLYRTTLAALFLALCIVLPISLHSIPQAGILFSPMHIPVLLCGLICGPYYGLLCGILGPILSSALTGMPVPAKLPGMIIELAIYGLISGLILTTLKKGNQLLQLYISLLVAMLLGRAVAGVTQAFIFVGTSYTWEAWATSYFVTSFPGILIQLTLIPIVYFALQRTRLLPEDK